MNEWKREKKRLPHKQKCRRKRQNDYITRWIHNHNQFLPSFWALTLSDERRGSPTHKTTFQWATAQKHTTRHTRWWKHFNVAARESYWWWDNIRNICDYNWHRCCCDLFKSHRFFLRIVKAAAVGPHPQASEPPIGLHFHSQIITRS